MKRETRFLVGAATVVLIAVAAGLWVLGSPAAERSRRLDARRVADLQTVMTAADLYWTRHDSIPMSLVGLEAEPGIRMRTRDPATGDAYAYRRIDGPSYEVCAVFDAESPEMRRSPESELWVHGAGRHCFTFDAKEIERNER